MVPPSMALLPVLYVADGGWHVADGSWYVGAGCLHFVDGG